MTNTGIYTIKKLDDPNNENVLRVLADINRASEMLNWVQHDKIKNDTGLLIAIGGDGTMMHGLKLSAAHQIPVIGFNLGKLGFLAEYSPHSVLETLALAIKNALVLERRTLLECTIENTTYTAVNEIVFSPLYADKMLRYQFEVNNIFSGKHLANGVMVSTPTGSTAYALSSGGTILQPEVPAFEIIPIAAVSLNARGVVVANTSDIKVSLYTGQDVEYMVSADGQRVFQYKSKNKEVLEFKLKKAPNEALVLHHPDWNFFTTLSEKLKWNTTI